MAEPVSWVLPTTVVMSQNCILATSTASRKQITREHAFAKIHKKIVLAYTDILLDAKIRLLPLPVKHYCDSLQQTASCVWVAITLLGIASVNYVEVIMQYGLVDGDIFGCSSCPR